VLLLRYRVGYNDLVKRTSIDAVNSIAAQNAMGNEGNDPGCALLLQKLCGAGNGIRGIRQVIHQDGCAVPDISNQHHRGVLSVADLCRAALFVDEGKRHAECVGDGGCALGASSIRGDYNGLLVVGDVELDVFAEQMAAVEVVNRYVEETLVLRVWSHSQPNVAFLFLFLDMYIP